MRRVLLCLVLALMLSVSAAAEELSVVDTEELEYAVPEDVMSLFDDLSLDADADLESGLQDILSSLSEQSGGAIRSAVRSAAVILSIVMLCSLVGQFGGSLPANAVTVAGVLAIMAACAGNLNTMISLGKQTMDQVQVFSNVLLPTMAAATVASGATNASAAIYAATVLFSNLLMNCITALLLPMVYAYLALQTADAAIGNDTLRRMAELLHSLLSSCLKWLLLVYIAYLSITGVVSGSADSAQIRAAKLALSGAVPVVGSIIADASETVLVSAALLRTSVGVFGMLVILGICAYPFLRIGVQYLILKLTAALSAALGDKRLVRLIDAVSGALGFLLAMTGADALMLLISCVCSMKAVSV
jgi:stage III sporulation protein AE